MNAQAGHTRLVEAVEESLRTVKHPAYSRDIVSFGFLKNVTARSGTVTVELEIASAKSETAFQIQAEAERVLEKLPELKGFGVRVEITSRPKHHDHSSNGLGPPLSPLQDEGQEDGGAFDPDPMVEAMIRPDLAPGAGYGEAGPAPLGGPMGDRTSTTWQGALPVFQWEIDPLDRRLQQYGEHEVEREGWIFRTWWQVHPAGLVYACISAILEEDEEERPAQARRHPIGRNVAVNLVYDLRRQGFVAIYGTALDFRPFVEIFITGFGVEKLKAAGAASPAQEIKP